MSEIPSDRPLERSVIATVAMEPVQWQYVASLTPDHFLDLKAKEAFSEMTERVSEGRGWVAVNDGLEASWITMGELIPTSFQLEEAVARLRDVYACRVGYLRGGEMMRAAIKRDASEVERLVSTISLPARRSLGFTAEDVAADILGEWGPLDGRAVPTGYSLLDAKHILKRREGFGLAARPSMGKSQLAFQIGDRKSTRLNSSHSQQSRMPSSA